MTSAASQGGAFRDLEAVLAAREPGWWDRIVGGIPELEALAGTPQPARYHGEGDVATHTRLAVEACPHGGDPDLLWAALLHDLGKPATTRVRDGEIRSLGHAREGAAAADAVLERLGMPRERRERIVWAVRHHTFHLSWGLTRPDDASRRQLRFVADPRFPLLLGLLRADSLASLGNPRGLGAHELYTALRARVADSPG